MNWLIRTALAAESFLARIVPPCDPSITDFTLAGSCNMDQLLLMGQNIVNFLITAAFVITVFFIVIGAFRMIISGGNEKALSAAKGNITSALIGLLIVLTSWVVLNTAITWFKSDNCTGSWYKFGDENALQCGGYIGEDENTGGEVGVYCKARPGVKIFCRDIIKHFSPQLTKVICMGGPLPGGFVLNQYCQWNSTNNTCVNKGSEVDLCAKWDCGAIEITDTPSAQICNVNPCCQVPEVQGE